jgi:hypothetical protein
MLVFNEWYRLSQPFLDPGKTRDDYLAAFLAELGKVRVPTGDGDTLKKALEHVSTLSVSELPVIPDYVDAPESWRRIAALHRELSRRSTNKNKTYFLSCRDAASVFPSLSHQKAYTINLALAELGVVKIVRTGDKRLGGKLRNFDISCPKLKMERPKPFPIRPKPRRALLFTIGDEPLRPLTRARKERSSKTFCAS